MSFKPVRTAPTLLCCIWFLQSLQAPSSMIPVATAFVVTPPASFIETARIPTRRINHSRRFRLRESKFEVEFEFESEDPQDKSGEIKSLSQEPLELQVELEDRGDNYDDDEDDDSIISVYNAVPLFTGSIILLASLFFTGYGFYVFATGNDPIFLNVRPTAPPPDSWYN